MTGENKKKIIYSAKKQQTRRAREQVTPNKENYDEKKNSAWEQKQ